MEDYFSKILMDFKLFDPFIVKWERGRVWRWTTNQFFQLSVLVASVSNRNFFRRISFQKFQGGRGGGAPSTSSAGSRHYLSVSRELDLLEYDEMSYQWCLLTYSEFINRSQHRSGYHLSFIVLSNLGRNTTYWSTCKKDLPFLYITNARVTECVMYRYNLNARTDWRVSH